MSHTVSFGNVTKRKNSTLQGGTTATFNVLFKTPTSLDRPTFVLNTSDFDYNYAKMGNRYYFVEDIVYKNNGIVEVSCVLDVLATYKAQILASTQYVCYSNVSGGAWLPDTRIPVLKSTSVARATANPSIFSDNGCYTLSVVGKDSAATYKFPSTAQIKQIIAQISSWQDDAIDELHDLIDDTDTDSLLESLSKVISNSSLVGNAYSQAPSCVRSCIWTPFEYAGAPTDGQDTIFLGNFDTGITGTRVKASPRTSNTSVSIPWQFNDWRRGYCEDVYLYLPLVGMVAINGASITNVNSLTVKWSATYTDGCIAYEVLAGNEVIGTYGANCAANYPIGVNQQASAGEIVTTLATGIAKTVSAGVSAVGSLIGGNVGGAVSSAVEGKFSQVSTAYNTINTAMSTHASCVGGIGGGAGSGLDSFFICYTVAHNTVIEPSQMAVTMGIPTMKPLQLSSCSGFCQCANAHVPVSAESWVMDAIDAYVNSGFYIE